MNASHPSRNAGRRRVAATFLVAMLVAIVAIGCSDRDRVITIGAENIESERFESVVVSRILSPPAADRYAEFVVGTGSSRTLYAGFLENRPNQLLVRFRNLPTGTVSEAELVLSITGGAGDESDVSLAVHRVTSAWREPSSTADSLPDPTFDADPLAIVVSAPDDTVFTLALPDTLVQTWVDGPDDENHGLMVAPVTELAVLRKFASREASEGRPFLHVVTEQEGSEAEADTVVADQDTYVTAADSTRDFEGAERIRVGREHGLTYRSTIEYLMPSDLDPLSTINHARLELNVDTLASDPGDGGIFVGAHRQVILSESTGDTVFTESADNTVTFAGEADTMAINLTSYVVDNRRDGIKRFKILLRTSTETADTDFVSLFSSDDPAADRWPRLRLIIANTSAPPETLTVKAAATGPAP